MLKILLALLYASAFSSAVYATYEYENAGGLVKTKDGRKAASESLTGEEKQNEILNYQKGDANPATAERVRIQQIQQAPDPSQFETPADTLARFNNMKRTGNGAVNQADAAAANCTPLPVKGRSPANAGGVDGYRCNKILPGSGFARAGIQNGDIVKSIDGKKVNSMLVGPSLLRKIEDADYSQIVIVREGREAILAPPLR